MTKVWRQGDVFIIEQAEMPDGGDLIPYRGQIVLAYGEVTGHSHTIEVVNPTAIKWINVGEKRYLKTDVPVVIKHQEHDPISLPAGTFEVRIQREYTPQEIRRVID